MGGFFLFAGRHSEGLYSADQIYRTRNDEAMTIRK